MKKLLLTLVVAAVAVAPVVANIEEAAETRDVTITIAYDANGNVVSETIVDTNENLLAHAQADLIEAEAAVKNAKAAAIEEETAFEAALNDEIIGG